MNGGQFLKGVGWTVAVLIGLVILIPVLLIGLVFLVNHSFQHEVDPETVIVTVNGRAIDNVGVSDGWVPRVTFTRNGCEYRQSTYLPGTSGLLTRRSPPRIHVGALNVVAAGGDVSDCPSWTQVSNVSVLSGRLVPIGTTPTEGQRGRGDGQGYALAYMPRRLVVQVTFQAWSDDESAPMEFVVSFRSRTRFHGPSV